MKYNNKSLFVALLLSTCAASAQKIDFDFYGRSNVTETDFSAWSFAETESVSAVYDGVTIKISASTSDELPNGVALITNWWKDGVNKYSKLTSDGINVRGNGDDYKYLTDKSVTMTFEVSGLQVGAHSIMFYLNDPEGRCLSVLSAPITMTINGTEKQTDILLTSRSQKPSEVTKVLAEFDVETEDNVTIISLTSNPQDGVEYGTSSVYVNAMVFEASLYQPTDPIPANANEHVELSSDGSTELLWVDAAASVKSHVMFGTDASILTEIGVSANGTFTSPTNLSNLSTYYWRIDAEDADGNVYKGDVWSFRPAHLAFPGAEGYGRYAIGGRGGIVYHVTSLDDDATNPAEGTFRYGITQLSGPRTIVFDVSGVIELKDRLTCSDKYVTIAGQTAPGNGIMFRGAPFGMASDGITRFIRMRVGGGDDWDGVSPNENTSDGLGMAGNDYSIMDHCSVGWTIDEAFSSRNAKNVTLQRTLISETLNQAGHKNYVESKGTTVKHGYAATIGGDYGSYHHNLLAHNEGRNWSLSGGLDGGGAYAGHHDVFNNVVYNWGGRATDGGTHECNFVNNYYKMGASTTQTILLKAELEGTGTGTQSYYVSGNIRENIDGSKTEDLLGETYKYVLSNGATQGESKFVSTPFFDSYATIETAEEAYKNTLCDVGCNQPFIDNHDARIINETLTGTTSTVGSRSGKKGLIDKESDSEGFDGLNIIEEIRPADFDTDGDGMPNWFERLVGTNEDAADNNADDNNDGYTALEEYLNWIAEPHYFINNSETLTINMHLLFAAYNNNPTFVCTSSSSSLKTQVDGATLTLTPTSTNGLYSVAITATDADSYTLTRTINIAVSDDMQTSECTTPVRNIETENVTIVGTAIYDLSGWLLQNADNVSNLPHGIYLEVVSFSDGTKKAQRVRY